MNWIISTGKYNKCRLSVRIYRFIKQGLKNKGKEKCAVKLIAHSI